MRLERPSVRNDKNGTLRRGTRGSRDHAMASGHGRENLTPQNFTNARRSYRQTQVVAPKGERLYQFAPRQLILSDAHFSPLINDLNKCTPWSKLRIKSTRCDAAAWRAPNVREH
jgi:hypothetical protein